MEHAAATEHLIEVGVIVALAVTGLLVLFVVRPATAWIGLSETITPKAERGAIAFFGIRGVGSLYYLAYAVEHADFPRRRPPVGARRLHRRRLDPRARHVRHRRHAAARRTPRRRAFHAKMEA